MKIALAQTHIEWEAKMTNIAKAEKIISNQARDGVSMILFPEMSFTGFSMNTTHTGEIELNTLSAIKAMAKKNKVSVGFGWVKKTEGKCQNVYTILNDEGEVISSYAKIHPFSYSGEDKYFVGGEKVVTYDVGGVPFSSFICYDLRFPEVFRAIADFVHAVIVPANWPAKRAEQWKTLLRARAIENQVYVFAVNCVGDMGGQYYSGDSCVINPDGKILQMLSNQEGVLSFEFEDDVEKYRNEFPVLKDRKGAW